MSDLVYDNAAKCLTLRDRCGVTVGKWPADNNVDSSVGLVGLPNGVYRFKDATSPHRHHGDSSHGAYGPAGILMLEDFTLNGRTHQGAGVHSGRKDVPDLLGREGIEHCTLLCVRTTDTAMSMITMTMRHDPLKTLLVRNSGVRGEFVNTDRPPVAALPGYYTLHPRGAGASSGPLPHGYVMVSRCIDAQEAKLWMAVGGTHVPLQIGAGGRVYVTEFEGPRISGTGPIRVDLAVP